MDGALNWKGDDGLDHQTKELVETMVDRRKVRHNQLVSLDVYRASYFQVLIHPVSSFTLPLSIRIRFWRFWVGQRR